MPPYLPREIGESGALRVSAVGEPSKRPYTRRKIQKWIKDQYEPESTLDTAARRIREANRDKVATSRMQRPARVS